MRKRLFLIASFGLVIILTMSAGCVSLPAATTATGSPVATSVPSAEPTAALGPGESSAGSPMATGTPVMPATAEVSTAVAAGGGGPIGGVTLVPTVEATAAQPAPGAGRSVTLDDNGKTITLQPGDRFLLNLGEGYNWDVSIADQNVVSRVIGVLTIRGSQGLFEAHQPGTTSLTASGDPVCRSQQPPCEAPSRIFEVQLVVTSGTS